ncbi:16S rRNA (cytidine(1402)-2'-O)-methyltransferase [uncultured Tyzzerella sp.]|uniref:16S rRNA (cytidine(1402)-2'-O)-methyltransferase n=1 Tax=uncultured Tyzzerella sp. TaxID=2321398 RepID=UPI0029426041|nr:16S rRNA (cytidine(1402)-2'-O)-methyltransferase [uncultured Tyzzerella sp.]
MSGKLYVCATPIGNLKDITLRCLETLKEVDLIASEDTRHTIKLLNHYEIKVPLESYHENNKDTKGKKLINLLLEGKNIALVSDAGMPGICDPGEDLIKLCYENEIEVTVLPGATASITALILSGIKTRSYCFEGFLPSNKKAKKEVIQRIKNDTRTYIIYEAPHHLLQTLKELYDNIGNRNIAIVKELTKKYENVFKTSIIDALAYFENNTPKGEYVLVIEGAKEEDILNEQKEQINNITIKEHLNQYVSKGMDIKEAMKKVAKDRGISKRDVYNEIKVLKI